MEEISLTYKEGVAKRTVKAGWLSDCSINVYRKYLYAAFLHAETKYNIRAIQKGGEPNEAKRLKSIKNEHDKLKNVEKGGGQMPKIVKYEKTTKELDVGDHFPFYKFGRIMGNKQLRWGRFTDTDTMIYFKSADAENPPADKPPYSMKTAKYEIQSQAKFGQDKWINPEDKYRLVLTFVERGGRSIYVYSKDMKMLQQVKYKMISSNKNDSKGTKLAVRKMALLMEWRRLVGIWNPLLILKSIIFDRSNACSRAFKNIPMLQKALNDQYTCALFAWQEQITERSKIRIVSTMRTGELDSQFHQPEKSGVDDEKMKKSQTLIARTFKKHKVARSARADAFIAKAENALIDGVQGHIVYFVADGVQKKEMEMRARGDRNDALDMSLFGFNCNEQSTTQGMLIVGENGRTLNVYDEEEDQSKLILDKLNLTTISCIFEKSEAKDVPKNDRVWLQINGPKIETASRLLEEVGSKGKPIFVDPASISRSRRVLSKLCQKKIIEFNIQKCMISDPRVVEDLCGSTMCSLACIIKIGHFYQRTTFENLILPKKQLDWAQQLSFDMTEGIDHEATISLLAVQSSEVDMKDGLQDFKSPKVIGFTRLRFEDLLHRGKAMWLPLNNSHYGDAQMMGNYSMVLVSISQDEVKGSAKITMAEGKSLAIGGPIIYKEKTNFTFPTTQEQVDSYFEGEDEFDMNKLYSQNIIPLRVPVNAFEYQCAGFDGTFNDFEKTHGVAIKKAKRVKNKVPFMYFLPETKEEFEEMKLGGIYSEVTKQYRPQELVLELSVYWHKKNAILKGIDSNGICYLKELLSDQNAKPKKFKKKLEEIEPIEDIGGVSIFNKEVFFPNSLSEARCNYEWSMYVGVGNEQTKENILNGLKNAIKSAYYNELIGEKNTRKAGEYKEHNQAELITGSIGLTIVEAKNLYLFGNDKKPVNSVIEIGFASSRIMLPNFSEEIREEDSLQEVEEIQDSFMKRWRSKPKAGHNPDWSEESPEDRTFNIRRMIKGINANIEIIAYHHKGKEQDIELGKAKLKLDPLMDIYEPGKLIWLLLYNQDMEKIQQLKVWIMFTPTDNTLRRLEIPKFKWVKAIEFFRHGLRQKGLKASLEIDDFGQEVSLGEYDPNMYKALSKEDLYKSYVSEKHLMQNPFKQIPEQWMVRFNSLIRWNFHMIHDKVFDDLKDYYWDQFITKLMMNITMQMTQTMQKIRSGGAEKELQKEAKKYQGALLSLNRQAVWEMHDSWKYNDLYYLCKLGIPHDIRPKIWCEMFRVYELYPNAEDEGDQLKISQYLSYLSRVTAKDCSTFQQIEEDILKVTFSVAAPSRQGILKQIEEKEFLMRIMKAYIVWTFDQTDNQYCYTMGILQFTQKLIQIMSEENAFWCLIGFAKYLPLIFQMENAPSESVSGHGIKTVLTAINNILKTRFPHISNMLIQFGLPIEYYLSDKVSCLYANVFPMKTLMRIYDLIALEAGSENTLRATWVIICTGVALFELNQEELRYVNNADEVKIILNNTGINHLEVTKIMNKIKQLTLDFFLIAGDGQKVTKKFAQESSAAQKMDDHRRELDFVLEHQYAKVKHSNNVVKDILGMKKGRGKDPKQDMGKIQGLRQKLKKALEQIKREPNESPDLRAKSIHLLFQYVDTTETNLKQTYLNITYYKAKTSVNTIASPDHNFCEYLDLDYVPGGNQIKIEWKMGSPKTKGGGDVLGVIEFDLADIEMDTVFPMVCMLQMPAAIYANPESMNAIHSQLHFLALVRCQDHQKQFVNHFEFVTRELLLMPSQPLQDGVTEVTDETGPRLIAFKEEQNRQLPVFDIQDMKQIIKTFVPIPSKDLEDVANTFYGWESDCVQGVGLRQFICSIIALSVGTLDKKWKLLYKLFSGLHPSGRMTLPILKLMVQNLFAAYLYHMKASEMNNMVEKIFERDFSRVTEAYLTPSDVNTYKIFENMRKEEVLPGKPIELKKLLGSGYKGQAHDACIEVTPYVVSAVNKYHSIVGNKNIPIGKHGPFGRIENILDQVDIPKPTLGEVKLIVNFKLNQVYHWKEFIYTPEGKLLEFSKERAEEEGVPGLMWREQNMIPLEYSKTKLEKEEFMTILDQLPVVSELMRLENSLDQREREMVDKTPMKVDIEVCDEMKTLHCIFHFDPKNNPKKDLTLTSQFIATKLQLGDSKTKGNIVLGMYKERNNVYHFNLSAAHEEDLISETEQRVKAGWALVVDQLMEEGKKIPEQIRADLFQNPFSFFHGQMPVEGDGRLGKLFKKDRLEGERFLKITMSPILMEGEEGGGIISGDCYNRFRHCDGSYEWKLCEVESKIPGQEDFIIKSMHMPDVTLVRGPRDILFPFPSKMMGKLLKNTTEFQSQSELARSGMGGKLTHYMANLSRSQKSKLEQKHGHGLVQMLIIYFTHIHQIY